MTKSFSITPKGNRSYKLENYGKVSEKILKHQRLQLEKSKTSLVKLSEEIKGIETSLNNILDK